MTLTRENLPSRMDVLLERGIAVSSSVARRSVRRPSRKLPRCVASSAAADRQEGELMSYTLCGRTLLSLLPRPRLRSLVRLQRLKRSSHPTCALSLSAAEEIELTRHGDHSNTMKSEAGRSRSCERSRRASAQGRRLLLTRTSSTCPSRSLRSSRSTATSSRTPATRQRTQRSRSPEGSTTFVPRAPS